MKIKVWTLRIEGRNIDPYVGVHYSQKAAHEELWRHVQEKWDPADGKPPRTMMPCIKKYYRLNGDNEQADVQWTWLELPAVVYDKPLADILKRQLTSLANSCAEGYDGTWDCTGEGRKSFIPMHYGLVEIARLLGIKIKPKEIE